MADITSVEVALRIRPLVESEISKGCKSILEVFEEYNQVKLKSSSFSYNHVFDCDTTQEDFYTHCINPIVPNLFKGYNVTILAYGQTGSGKTHSMGTNYNGTGEMGVIPRVMQDIFNHINNDKSNIYEITVSFMELYQEVLYDLLANKSRYECCLDIREDAKGIQIPGLTQVPIHSSIDALSQLLKGSEKRAVGSTNMNKQSSRSHAIFTVNIVILNQDNSMSQKSAKFHLVDLAGSERSKKTGATGTTFKEGVNINKGLLALGNVISALGDEKLSQGFISYRDSNLTRLLKDSLGGNSLTLMIACVSPADYNLEETLSTLRYADRARKIKNKPIVNEDPKVAEINKLNEIINKLRLELAGKGSSYIYQNTKQNELEEKCNNLMLTLSSTLGDKVILHEKLMNLQASNENGVTILNAINSKVDTLIESDEHLDDYNYLKEGLEKLGGCLKKCVDSVVNDDVLYNNKDLLSESAIREKQESYTTNQIAMNTELEKVSKMITIKENLAKQIASNAHQIIDCTSVFENEERIRQLENEKIALLAELKTSKQIKSNTHSDEKKKEVQELEKKIDELKKKVTQQERLIKLKKKDEEKIGSLNRDILSLKQTKVKLVKNMLVESDRFRKWKNEKERELTKLKTQNMKKENEMVKMERLHSRQQNVLRRKVEEATAINKRLKDALALRKQAKDQNANKNKNIGQWIQDELELFINVIDARNSLEVLIEDRTLLQEELDMLKSNPTTTSEELAQLQNEIEVRSAQISDFQNKILDSDDDGRSKNRWDHIQSMSDAKHTLQILLDKIAEIRKKGCLSELKTNELRAVISERNKKNEDLIKELAKQESFFKTELNNIEQHYAEKISILLRQIYQNDKQNGVTDEDSNKFSVQLEFIDNLQAINSEQLESIELLQTKVKDLENENANLQNRIDNINTLVLKQKSERKPRNTTIYQLRGYDDSDLEENDDKIHDPDWRKTPLAKRLKELKNPGGESEAVKRNANDGCACKRKCNTKSCKCKKLFSSCTPACRCSADICVNRDNENESNENSASDDSYKKLKIDDKRNISKFIDYQ